MTLREIKYIIFIFLTILFINSLIIFLYPYFGCLEMNSTNLFRGNLACFAFTNINYHIQKYQMDFYIIVSGFILKTANTLIQDYLNIKLE